RRARSSCERSTVGKASPKSLTIKSLTSPHDRIASLNSETRHRIPTQPTTAPMLIPYQRMDLPGHEITGFWYCAPGGHSRVGTRALARLLELRSWQSQFWWAPWKGPERQRSHA